MESLTTAHEGSARFGWQKRNFRDQTARNQDTPLPDSVHEMSAALDVEGLFDWQRTEESCTLEMLGTPGPQGYLVVTTGNPHMLCYTNE